MTGTDLCVNKSQFVPVIFEPPCTILENGYIFSSFLGAVSKLRTAIISFFMSVRPSAWNNSAPTGRILMKFCIR